jgi:hypothetical protein
MLGKSQNSMHKAAAIKTTAMLLISQKARR